MVFTDPYNSIQNTGNITINSAQYHSDSLNINLFSPGDVDANQLREEFGPDFPVPVAVIDTISADFQIFWDAVPAKFIAAGLFAEPPDIKTIDGNAITNSGKCVWLWNNGFGTGSSGQIAFDDGRSIASISNGEPVYANTLHSLQKGKTYFLMMWAWNSDATRIIYSSKLIRISIKAP